MSHVTGTDSLPFVVVRSSSEAMVVSSAPETPEAPDISRHAGTTVRFAAAVVLTRREVFEALEACAIAERALVQAGRPAEAGVVAALFEALEDRVSLDIGCPSAPYGEVGPLSAASASGSNSMDKEFTQ